MHVHVHVYDCFLNLYIIEIFGRSIKIICEKNYRFMADILKKIIYLKFCYVHCKYLVFIKDFIMND